MDQHDRIMADAEVQRLTPHFVLAGTKQPAPEGFTYDPARGYTRTIRVRDKEHAFALMDHLLHSGLATTWDGTGLQDWKMFGFVGTDGLHYVILHQRQ